MDWHTRFTAVIFSAALLVSTNSIARADDDQVLQDALNDPAPWNISSLVKGNSRQVRDAINGPLEEQLGRKAEKQKHMQTVKADCDQKLAVIATNLRKSNPDFAKAESDLTAAKAALVTAHDSGNGKAAIDAQNRIQTDQDTIKAKLDAASVTDPDVTKDKKEIDDIAVEIQHLGPVIANAAKARETIVGGLRFSQILQGPASANKKGFLGKIKPVKIIDEHSFTVDFDLVTVTGEDKTAKNADGMTTVTGSTMKIHMLVSGYEDTSKLKEKVETIVDQYYQLDGQKTVNGKTYYVAQRVQPDDEELLLEHRMLVLDTLRVPEGVVYKP